METNPANWWVLVVAGLPALIVGMWQRNRDTTDKREERRADEREKLRQRMDSGMEAWFNRLEKDLSREIERRQRVEEELTEAERRADRGYELARAWRSYARELRHDLLGVQQVCTGLTRETHPDHIWEKVPELPPLEALDGDGGKT